MLDPRLHWLLAQYRSEELQRVAAAHRRVDRPGPRPPIELLGALTLRFGFPDDAEPLARLAALDSSEPPRHPVLLAEVENELRAAMSLLDGAVVADPFQPTEAVVELLQARARQLDPGRQGRRSRRLRDRLGLGLLAWR